MTELTKQKSSNVLPGMINSNKIFINSLTSGRGGFLFCLVLFGSSLQKEHYKPFIARGCRILTLKSCSFSGFIRLDSEKEIRILFKFGVFIQTGNILNITLFVHAPQKHYKYTHIRIIPCCNMYFPDISHLCKCTAQACVSESIQLC